MYNTLYLEYMSTRYRDTTYFHSCNVKIYIVSINFKNLTVRMCYYLDLVQFSVKNVEHTVFGRYV